MLQFRLLPLVAFVVDYISNQGKHRLLQQDTVPRFLLELTEEQRRLILGAYMKMGTAVVKTTTDNC